MNIQEGDKEITEVRVKCASHLEHQSTHAEDHAKEVHVVWRRVLQCGVSLCAWGLIPATTHVYIRLRGSIATKFDVKCPFITAQQHLP